MYADVSYSPSPTSFSVTGQPLPHNSAQVAYRCDRPHLLANEERIGIANVIERMGPTGGNMGTDALHPSLYAYLIMVIAIILTCLLVEYYRYEQKNS